MAKSFHLKGSREYADWLKKRGLSSTEVNYKRFRFEVVSYFTFLGFKDYLTARHLLLEKNNDYHLVGYILASTAIEKYFKALLFCMDVSPGKNHLDKLDQFKALLISAGVNGIKILEALDDTFLKLMADTYKFRYFDETSNSDGAFVNHVLGELDFTVNLIESSIQITKDGKIEITAYQKAVADKNHPIHVENYILTNVAKKTFMEKESDVYGVKTFGDGIIIELKAKGMKLLQGYSGKIATFKMERKK